MYLIEHSNTYGGTLHKQVGKQITANMKNLDS